MNFNPANRVATAAAGTCVALGLVILTAGCSAAPTAAPAPLSTPAASASAGGLSGTIIVDAAASLSEAFGMISAQFERQHPGVTVTLNFGGSSALAQSILSGAPVDVFAAASPATMATVTDAKLATDPRPFASNSLEIAVPAGNPGHIRGLADFADPARTIALCAPQVPCGASAAQVFAAAGVTPAPDTLEEDVKAALTKVRLGEVDAALVYRTDVTAAGSDVEGIEFSESAAATTEYQIAELTGSTSGRTSAAFVDYVLGDAAQKVLRDAGFAAR